MYFVDTKLRVRYGETDQMGYVYYGVYAQYYEVGRVELLRSIGIPYKQIESMGFSLPVVNWSINYRKPALYDDQLTIRTIIHEVPSKKIVFECEIFNEDRELLNTGQVTLIFVDNTTNRSCSAPEIVLRKIKENLL